MLIKNLNEYLQFIKYLPFLYMDVFQRIIETLQVVFLYI